MDPRQARRERREAERKAKKLELKKSRLAEQHPLAAVEKFPEIQPRWNPELEDEFPREVQIRNNAMADLVSLKAGLPIPPPGPSPVFKCVEDIRAHLLAKRKAAGKSDPPAKAADTGFVSQSPTDPPLPHVGTGHVRTARPAKPSATPTELGFVSQTKPSRAQINRANSQSSTGPTSMNGKLASSRNSLKHGLASGQLIIPGEDHSAFQALLNDLLEEHQPASLTEKLLIEEMAQSHWLTQRAIRYQNDCFTADGVDQKQLALLLRYQTTHQRAFYKALNTLIRFKKDAARLQNGFVSQPRAVVVGAAYMPPAGPENVSAAPTKNGFISQDHAFYPSPDQEQAA